MGAHLVLLMALSEAGVTHPGRRVSTHRMQRLAQGQYGVSQDANVLLRIPGLLHAALH